MKNRFGLVFVMGVGSLVMGSCRGGCNATDKGEQGADEEVKPGDYEGDDAGECRDGADNDQDGYFDCQDNGCWDSPDCDSAGDADVDADADADADVDVDTDTDTETVPCTDPICDLTEVEISVRYDWIPIDLLAALSFCPCYTTYAGEGLVVPGQFDANADMNGDGIVDSKRLSFEGTLTRTDNGPLDTSVGTIFEGCDPLAPPVPCSPIFGADPFGDGLWWNDPTGVTFHSFFFSAAVSPPEEIYVWNAHQFPLSFIPIEPAQLNNKQHFITNMYPADLDNDGIIDVGVYDHAPQSPTFHFEVDEADPFGQFDVHVTFDATFQK